MNIVQTSLRDFVIIEPNVFGDERDFFLDKFHISRYADLAGISLPFLLRQPVANNSVGCVVERCCIDTATA